jgi:MFS transporter, FSR family, fosmidomycin resistance protein
MQSLAPALYPVFRTTYSLSFFQTGMITFVFQVTASLLQPFIGMFTDRRPVPFALPSAMAFTLLGLVLLAFSTNYAMLLGSVALIGVGSAIFHPEASRVARLASGGRHGLAQSLFAVGGNAGAALGPLLAAFLILPRGQRSIAWVCFAALLAIAVLTRVSAWYAAHLKEARNSPSAPARHSSLSPRRVRWAMAILFALMFSKFFYLASLNSYFTFFLISRFHTPLRTAQIYLFIFLAAAAVGTLAGGPIGDRIGRKYVIWASILGVLPFTLLLPYANLFWTGVLTIVIGLVLASAFSAILVYAQDLVPGRVGTVSGLFYGLAFGLGGIGAAFLGELADLTSIAFVYHLCSVLPAIGLLAAFLPNLDPH